MPSLPGRRLFRLPWRDARRVADDVDEELGFHIDMRAAELVAAGLPPEQARAEARRRFGDLEFTRHYCRDLDRRRETHVRRTELFDALRQDLRFALRTLRRSPGFTAVAVLTLALGIGANTAIFSIVHGVLLRPLPWAEPEQLIRIFDFKNGQRVTPTPSNFVDWREQSRSFEGMAAIDGGMSALTGVGGEPEMISTADVSANLFSLLRVRPLLGRTFVPGEDEWGAPKVAVLSEGLWRRRFGADPDVLGRSVTIGGVPRTVVGVVPNHRGYPLGTEVWAPIGWDPEVLPRMRGAHYLRVVARLKPDVALEGAQTEMAGIAARLEEQYRTQNAGYGVMLQPLHQVIVGDIRTPLLVLLGAVGFVLLIACANVANLLLVRAAGREAEIAVRTALGAGRGRIVRQLVTESILLSLIGGAAGILIAYWGSRAFVALAPRDIPRLGEVGLDATVLLFTVAVAVLTGVLFGLVPAIQVSRPDLAQTLKEGGRTGSRARRGSQRARGVLVVAEMALAVALLIGAGLLARSFVELQRVDPGFRPDGVITFDVSLPDSKYEELPAVRAFAGGLLDELRGLPAARSAALAFGIPLTGFDYSLSLEIAGRPPAPPEAMLTTEIRVATPEYFATMGIPIVRGRGFTSTDREGSPQVVVINRAAVRRFFPQEDPLGKRVSLGWSRDGVRMGGEIVGIIGDVRQFSLDSEVQPEMYMSFEQWPVQSISAVVRTSAEGAALATAVRALVHELDPDLPVVGFRALDDVVSESVSQPRFYSLLLAAFAVVALLLASVGIYGVIAYGVAQRTHEIGIRVALGASGARVLRTVVGQGLALALLGVALGVAIALWVTRALASLLYGVTATDPLTFAGVGLLLLAVAALACWVPARRAASIDPMVALRSE
jgi:predicted permease